MIKRIDLFIYSLKGGGAERICVLISNQLSYMGYDVRLVVLSLESEKYLSELEKSVKLVCLNKKGVLSSFNSIRTYIKEFNPRIIMTFSYDISLVILLIRKIFKNNFKIISRNVNTLSLRVKNEKSIMKRVTTNILLKLFYNKVDYIICQSKGMYSDLIENYRFKADKMRIINNPVGEKFINEGIKKVDVNNKEILFVGRLEKQKGVNFLIKAFSEALKYDKDILLRIVGSGSLKNEIENEIAEMSIENNVIIENFTDNIIQKYKNSRVVVLSSLFEGFPNVLVEAITLGIPVVSFNCPSGPNEIIIDRVNGILVDYLDIEKLSLALIEAINFKWDKDKIIESSRKFHVENIMKQYIEVIHTIECHK